ncbi:hypothetical protein SmJEL517_g04839 [Synchytrium microbalum]|uniref:Uncharacterized protein n=1 Tax=Synchytrium microbalum TaxID=1806994 RepID=A0A507BYJ2_9FUNG|nr:uncharacterized protein SmJEL517_g04839 [Synchytrium microbalum]TPX31929.1 hypothetical protein SmJEL517_g04839 [Synchytrium microbalum]
MELAQVDPVDSDAAAQGTNENEMPDDIVNDSSADVITVPGMRTFRKFDEGQALYKQCISVLTDLSQRKPQKFSLTASYGDQDTDIVIILWHYISRTLFSRRSQPIPSHAEPERLPADVEVYDESLQVPDFVEHDPPLTSRIKATRGLMIAGLGMHNKDALLTLGDMYLLGQFNHPRNATLAVKYYNILSRDYGNATAQSRLGFLYAAGIGVPRNYAKALVYTSFAAVGGDTAAEQTLGYYSQLGIASPKNCEEAAFYYKRVADKAMERYRAGPPGGLHLPKTRTRLYEADGGIYRSGASGPGNPNQGGHHGYHWSPQEALQYHHYSADRVDGDVTSQVPRKLLLGQTYYSGSSHVAQNFTKALHYFRKAAKQYPEQAIAAIHQAQARGEPLPTLTSLQHTRATIAAKAAGYLGQMYWRGEGIEQNIDHAKWYFERGAKQGDGASHTGLGMMFEEGVAGLPVDLVKAQHHYVRAAELNDADGRVHLGDLLLNRKIPDYTGAFKAFAEAVKQGHMYAHYRVGEMMIDGLGTQKNCPAGVAYLKTVVERADWHDPIVLDAEKSYLGGDVEVALLKYLMAAERGYDLAQMNAVWLIDQGIYDISKTRMFSNETDIYEVALTLWNRAANQGNVDARVKMGDYYFYGLGTKGEVKEPIAPPPETPLSDGGEIKTHNNYDIRLVSPSLYIADLMHSFGLDWLMPHGLLTELLYARGHPDYERAALYYQVAAESEFSAMAMWNLGWMHEAGLGVERDYHLAKRFYDRSLQTNHEAYLPVNLCLLKLHIKWAFYSIFSPSSIVAPPHIQPTSEKSSSGSSDSQKTRLGRDGLPGEDPYLNELEDESWDWDSWWEGENGEDLAETVILVVLVLIGIALFYWRQALNRVVGPQQQQQQQQQDQLRQQLQQMAAPGGR